MLSQADAIDDDLSSGTLLLRGQYDIHHTLAHGGFGITYLARDSLDRNVVVKECFPHAYCQRIGGNVRPVSPDCAPQFDRILGQFKHEALRLAALDHPRIVAVHQVFEENGTAFLAMEHIDGDDFFTIVEDHAERLDPMALRRLLEEALTAVQYIHEQGLLHRDLAPDNIVLGVNSHLTLIDFGAACAMSSAFDDETAKLLVVKDGYSPYEFYCDDVQDASSDLYSLAATFHYLITGCSPPDSQSRMAAVHAGKPDPFVALTSRMWGIEQALLDTINEALALDRTLRPQSAQEWVERLDGVQNEPTDVYAPIPMAFPDANIAEEIARLVSTTNSALARNLSEQRRKDTQSENEIVSPDVEHEPKQFVDLFGEPVHDIEAFLTEQDPPAETQPQTENTDLVQAADPVPKDEPAESNSVVGRMLEKMRHQKSSLDAAIPQT